MPPEEVEATLVQHRHTRETYEEHPPDIGGEFTTLYTAAFPSTFVVVHLRVGVVECCALVVVSANCQVPEAKEK